MNHELFESPYPNSGGVHSRAPRHFHDYDIPIGMMTRRPVAEIVRHLVRQFPEDFAVSAAALDRHHFRILHCAGCFGLFRLADPSFDAADEICCHRSG